MLHVTLKKALSCSNADNIDVIYQIIFERKYFRQSNDYFATFALTLDESRQWTTLGINNTFSPMMFLHSISLVLSHNYEY